MHRADRWYERVINLDPPGWMPEEQEIDEEEYGYEETEEEHIYYERDYYHQVQQRRR
jgi:hypothetical protein